MSETGFTAKAGSAVAQTPAPRVPVLELEAVAKAYPGQPPVHALRGVDLTVYEGELVAIVGPSGSGKSTLLHVIGTLDRPTAGTVRVTGFDVARLSDKQLAALRARRIGFVFQQFFLAEHATLLDNVGDGLIYTGMPARARRRLAAEALDRVGLLERAQSKPSKLSGGQRQRVAIARALVGRPAIVLADEPTGNLDSVTGASIIELLLDLHRQGSTIVVITHDHDLAERMPRRVDVLDGRIVADDAPAASRTTPSPETQRPRSLAGSI
jgi:putative ABC transport system ATP-binding protein